MSTITKRILLLVTLFGLAADVTSGSPTAFDSELGCSTREPTDSPFPFLNPSPEMYLDSDAHQSHRQA